MIPLAPEIIETILDEVEALGDGSEWRAKEESKKTLKACSLVAPIFLAPSQRLLFRSLTLGATSYVVGFPPKAVEAVAHGFADSPHLASYVRDFCVHLGDDLNSSHLTSLFRLLCRVERLKISHHGADKEWYSHLSPDFRDAFYTLLSLPSLRCLELRCLGLPSSLIVHALASYKEVVLAPRDIFLKEDHPAVDDGIPLKRLARTPPLTHLVLDYYPDKSTILHALMLSKDVGASLECLRSLKLTVPQRGSLGGLEKIALRCANSLHHLKLDFGISLNHEDSNAPTLALPTLPNLRSLTFKSTMTEGQVPDSIMSVFASLPRCTPRLEVLTFDVSADWEIPFKSGRSAAADKALKSLPRLQLAHFIVEADGVDGSLARSVRKLFPLCNTADLLGFSYPFEQRRSDWDC
ncbi:hypothetical protein FB451DRAFT_1274896 [Mycena latifolia]|nr:hypothetical protein FB451DRAFT_1274896 [Mycena latifolia]